MWYFSHLYCVSDGFEKQLLFTSKGLKFLMHLENKTNQFEIVVKKLVVKFWYTISGIKEKKVCAIHVGAECATCIKTKNTWQKNMKHFGNKNSFKFKFASLPYMTKRSSVTLQMPLYFLCYRESSLTLLFHRVWQQTLSRYIKVARSKF